MGETGIVILIGTAIAIMMALRFILGISLKVEDTFSFVKTLEPQLLVGIPQGVVVYKRDQTCTTLPIGSGIQHPLQMKLQMDAMVTLLECYEIQVEVKEEAGTKRLFILNIATSPKRIAHLKNLQHCQILHKATGLKHSKTPTHVTITIVAMLEEVETSLQAPEILQDQIGYKEK